MKPGIDELMREHLENQKKHFGQTLFSTREIADAVGLTISGQRISGNAAVIRSSGESKFRSGEGRAVDTALRILPDNYSL